MMECRHKKLTNNPVLIELQNSQSTIKCAFKDLEIRIGIYLSFNLESFSDRASIKKYHKVTKKAVIYFYQITQKKKHVLKNYE